MTDPQKPVTVEQIFMEILLRESKRIPEDHKVVFVDLPICARDRMHWGVTHSCDRDYYTQQGSFYTIPLESVRFSRKWPEPNGIFWKGCCEKCKETFVCIMEDHR